MSKDKEDPVDFLEDKRFLKKLQATFSIWLEQELQPLKEQISDLKQQKSNVPQVSFPDLEILNQEKKMLQEQLEKSQCELNLVKSNLVAKQKENQMLKEQLDKLQNQLQVQKLLVDKLQKELEEEKQSKKELQYILEETKCREINLKKKLDNCFLKGQEIFASLKELTPAGKDCLKAIYATNNLELFILSGLEKNSLERLWDETAACFVDKRESDAAIFWSCFIYFLELINKNNGKPIYELCNVSVGDAYDRDYHYNDRKGSMQGKVKEVKLLGYKDCISGDFVKRSIVTLSN